MKLNEFDFELPDRLIAQYPLPERDQSRMMVVWRKTGKREHRRFSELPEILGPEYFLVLNNTRVFPARLYGRRSGKEERIEVLLVRALEPALWLTLMKPAHKAPVGQRIFIGELEAEVVEARQTGARVLRFNPSENLMSFFERNGEPPLPPYIHRKGTANLEADRIRYQTVYATRTGSVAAPTAGLHFTEDTLRHLSNRGVGICKILLHVGYGTFQPVRCQEIENHRMEPEFFEVSDGAASFINKGKSDGRKLIAVGTTTTRTLEYLARESGRLNGAVSGFCDLYIYPGFHFQILDGLLTNFHLPRSTLFMLVCAFADRALMLDCYREAISQGYRFFSYGDCMLLL